jgi:hypothetical protein
MNASAKDRRRPAPRVGRRPPLLASAGRERRGGTELPLRVAALAVAVVLGGSAELVGALPASAASGPPTEVHRVAHSDQAGQTHPTSRPSSRPSPSRPSPSGGGGKVTLTWRQVRPPEVQRSSWTPLDTGWTGATLVALVLLAAGPGLRDWWQSR